MTKKNNININIQKRQVSVSSKNEKNKNIIDEENLSKNFEQMILLDNASLENQENRLFFLF